MAKVLVSDRRPPKRNAINGVDTASVVGTYVTTPNSWEPPSYATALPTGQTHNPNTAAELTTLLTGGTLDGKTLARNDKIVLDAGTTYKGTFEFPNLAGEASGAKWVYVVSSALPSLPAEGARINPSNVSNMPTLASPNGNPNTGPAVMGLDYGATRYRFVGIRFLCDAAVSCYQYGLIALGYDGADYGTPATSDSQLPGRIVFDRCIIEGRDTILGTYSDPCGMLLHGHRIAVLDSYFYRWKEKIGSDSQAIWSWNSGSRYLIRNNYISSAGEPMMIGAFTPTVGPHPADYTITNNYFHKPNIWDENNAAWDASDWVIKNLFEIKGAERVLLEGNIFDHNWLNERSAGQNGSAIVLTPRNQVNTDSTIEIKDIEFRYNIIRNCNNPLRMSNTDAPHVSGILSRLWFHNNLCYGIRPWGNVGDNSNGSATTGFHIQFVGSDTLVAGPLRFTHNTFVGGTTSYGASFYNTYRTMYLEGGAQLYGAVTFQDNIFEGPGAAEYTVVDSLSASPAASLTAYFVTNTYTTNVMFSEASKTYPAGNYNALTQAAVGFSNFATGGTSPSGFALTPGGTYAAGGANDASDGLDQGANITAVLAATAGVDS